jgi:fructose-1,6-bisphosphatase/inositol monophosphatase family enzyme
VKSAIVAHGDAYAFEHFGAREAYERMAAELPMFRGYTDAFGHALVLSGAVDVMVDCHLNPWDAAATQLLAREAGGACTTRINHAGKIDLVFGSPALVEQIEGYFQ